MEPAEVVDGLGSGSRLRHLARRHGSTHSHSHSFYLVTTFNVRRAFDTNVINPD